MSLVRFVNVRLTHLLEFLTTEAKWPIEIIPVIIWLCLTRTGNYQIHEFDWLKWRLTAV